MPPVHLQMIMILELADPYPVLHLQLDKSICQVGGGAQDKKFIPGYSKNVYRIALQNFVFLSFWLVTKMNYHLPLCMYSNRMVKKILEIDTLVSKVQNYIIVMTSIPS